MQVVGARSKPWTPALIPQGKCRRCQTSFLPPLGEQSPSGWATQLMVLLIAIAHSHCAAGQSHGRDLGDVADKGTWGWVA